MRNIPDDDCKRKVVVLCANSSWYIYNFRKSTVSAFVAEGHSVICLCGDKQYQAKLEQLGASFHCFYLSKQTWNIIYEFPTFLSVLSKIFRIRPDIVFSFTSKGVIYSSISSVFLRTRFVANISGQGSVLLSKGVKRKLYFFVLRKILQNAQKVFFQNKSDLFQLSKSIKLHPDRYELLAGSGVSLCEYNYTPLQSRKKIKFGLFCRLIEEKGVRFFVEAARHFNKRTDLSFVIGGNLVENRPGAVTNEEIAQWQDIKNLTYLGFSESVKKEIINCDCVVLPSYYPEGTPKILIEALAIGRPIITTSRPGCVDTVAKGNGLLMKAISKDALIDTIYEFIALSESDRLLMGEAGRALAEAVYDEEINIKKYLAELNF